MSELFGEGTPPLDEARAALEADRHLWWAIDCGHHENLFDAACEEIDGLKEELARTVAGLRAPSKCTASWAGALCRLPWGHAGLHDSNPEQADLDKLGRVQWSPAERSP